MKIIALMPIKNEAWILRVCLDALQKYVDEIIIIDDNSTDDSIQIAKSYGAKVFINNKSKLTYFSEYQTREDLLQKGRDSNGTHFVFLDADEIFSSNFSPETFRKKLSDLKRGEKIFMQWVPLWKSLNKYREDSRGIFKKTLKDFVFCDDKISHHSYAYIGVNRTPGTNNYNQIKKINEEEGVVLHFKYVNWNRNLYKQAWYKCSELINSKRSAKRINATYRHLLREAGDEKIREVPQIWIKDIKNTEEIDTYLSYEWYIKTIDQIFKQYGILFFERLEIWHIENLNNKFLIETGRKPVPETFPNYILFLNEIKNSIKNLI